VNRIFLTTAALALALCGPVIAHAAEVTAYTATHDISCMNDRSNLTGTYERVKTMVKPNAVAGLTQRWHSAMTNLVAFGDAHALEIHQGFEPRETCIDAGAYAIGKMLQIDTDEPTVTVDDLNPLGSFYATLRPTEEATLKDGLTCTNPYDFDIYLDKPKGKVFPTRETYQGHLPSLHCH
jgi:hypothetical protein